MIILIIIISDLIALIIGTIWLQIIQSKMGKKANYICNKCKAEDCQAKYCHTQRKRKEKEEN